MEQRQIERAVVTGPTGVLGLALCRQLLQKGCLVYAVCRPNTPRAARLPRHPRLQVIACDMARAQCLPELIPGGADCMFHLAWGHTMGSGREDMLAQNANVRYTIEHIHAAKALGCHTFVGAGSQAEYGRVEGALRPDTPCVPETGYGMAKLCAGQMARAECARLGMTAVWPRVLSLYGPGDNENALVPTLIRGLLAGHCPPLTPGEQLWDYLYAADAAEGLWLMALRGRPGGVYPLGSGQAAPLRRYVEQLGALIDPSVPLALGARPYAPGQVMRLQADLTALTRDTGFVPRHSFAQGAAETVAWYKTQQKASPREGEREGSPCNE